jgi:hypothetical protein
MCGLQVAGSSSNWNSDASVNGMAQALRFEKEPLLVPVCVNTGENGEGYVTEDAG